MQQPPLVSIIIPTYNRAHLIGETLDSVLAQTYQNWECIVVDDGSTDDTDKVMAQYCEKDSRIQYHHRPQDRLSGGNAARNYGFEMSKGEYVNWFDSDDIMHADFIKSKITYLLDDISLDFCACIGVQFQNVIIENVKPDKPKVMCSSNYLEDYLLNGLFFYTPGPLWRRFFLNNKSLFDMTMFRGQESDFHFRMLSYSPRYLYIDETLFYIRRGENGISKDAAKSYNAHESVFKYFDNAFKIIDDKEAFNSIKLKQYIFYRQCVNFYNLNFLTKGIAGRINILRNYSTDILGYSLKANTRFIVKTRILIGMLLLLFFKKGYRLFHYPEFDYRSNT